ncbi:MAG: Type 1 glutamine amidotransferase-like domain-containing protein, partial [bacterium]
HFCGGSVLYLINLLREKGFDKLIIDFVRKDRIIYTGTSAGSMIVAEDLKLSYYDPEETEYIDVKKMKDFSGLKFVNFLIIPHTNNKDFSKGNVEMVKYLSKFSQSLIFIYDNQAVWVEDDKFEILGN